MGKVLGFISSDFLFGFLKNAIYYAILTIFAVGVFAGYSSLVVSFFYFYELIQALLDMLSSTGGSATVEQFFGLLNCIGFTPAFNETKVVWLSGLTFIVSRIAIIYTLKAYESLLNAIAPLINK